MTGPTKAHRTAGDKIRAEALKFPEAWEDTPWGYPVYKVRKKIFVFLVVDGDGVSVGVKLPETAEFALTMDGVEPTGYGLGRSGWVTARFGPGETVPVDLLVDWIDESYRAIAPKTLVKQLG